MNIATSNSKFENALDSLLRAALWPREESISPQTLAKAVVLGGAIQGASMGAYAFLNGGSAAFIFISALKVPLFLGIGAALMLPAFYVLYALFGLGDEFGIALRALIGGQAAFALILASLSPLTLLFYLSGATYRGALGFNVALFALAAVAAQNTIRGRVKPLLERDARHATLLSMGFGLWVFVAIQLGWNLRPFVGNPDAPAQFFRPDAFTNAYFALWRLLVG
ncbi:hypothetical protein B1R32_101279 [Abditibacterium utsteinense]|uniref:Yip1 domain-containing protein n=1 Tax=Abditibacterium utsteinense TaxID=1960156 RepID=A0A2S8SXL1_9BACT|nr:hypothetical protein [Abditibacterium utsteinense]PQV65537.1 hypothetical protein B1R32_101279 [Abditibacterium utsteinense]